MKLTLQTDASPRYNISEPFNFQHLTHTTPQHVERIQRTNHEDLVSEFSAIRAAQAPRRELRGIKAMDIQQGIYFSKASASDTSSQPQTGYSTSTPGSPAHERSRIGSHSNEASVPARNLTNKRSKENFSQPSPSYHTAQSSPTSPPPRSSSRNKVPDFFTFHQESPTCGPFEPDISIEESEPFEYFPAAWKNGAYDSSLPHAVTTPDDTAHSIRPPPFSLIRTELAGVPEEDEISEGKRSSLTTSIVRSATPPSIRHAKSFPSTKSSLARWSGAPPHPAGEDNEQLPRQLTKSVCLLEPDMEEYKEEVPVRPRTSRRISLRKEESWEDVIDYCYEHQAEADCNFDWELASHFGEPNTALASSVGRSADSGTNNFDYATNTNVANDTLVDGEIGSGQYSSANLPSALVSLQHSLPDLQSPTPGSVESSFSSISEAVTPLPVESTVRRKASTSNSKGWSTSVPSAPFVMPEDSTPEYVFDDFYQKMLASHAACNPQLSLQTGLVDGSTISNSPRSSRSPISKSNSQESFWHSQVGAAPGRHRNTGSVGSLPELIQCRSVDKSDVVDHTAEQNAVIDASDTPADSSRHQRSPSLAKDVALKSMLSKVMTAEGREVLDAQLPLHPAFRDRACSDTPALPPPPQPPIARRMRSPSSASNLSSRRTSRASYSLFPSNAIR